MVPTTLPITPEIIKESERRKWWMILINYKNIAMPALSGGGGMINT